MTAPRRSQFDPKTGRGFLSGGRLLGLIGPAFVAAVAFVDPGNVATNMTAGVDHGYLLLWTVVAASLMAMLVQYLSAKLGLATGRSLAEVCRDNTSTPVRLGLWLVAEVVVIMTDLAEFVGGAVALNLLFGLPVFLGGLVVCGLTLLILQFRLRGRDSFPVFVVALLFVLGLGFAYLMVRSPFDLGSAAAGLVPRLHGSDSTLLACGIVGATVMPHAVFLHSSLIGGLNPDRLLSIRTGAMLRFLRRDVVVAMGLAGLINVLILLVATSLPDGSGGTLQSVHDALRDREGTICGVVFAIALLASGLASACAGLYSGQAIMQGFLRRDSSVWLRRVISAVPALIVLGLVSDPTQALIYSQVALAFGLPFALLPLMYFTAKASIMGTFVNRLTTTVAGLGVSGVVLLLNGFVLSRLFVSG